MAYFSSNSKLLAISSAVAVASGVFTSLTFTGTNGGTTITATTAAKLDYSAEHVVYPEQFVASTTDGGAAYTMPDAGIDGGSAPPVYPYNGQVDWTGAIQAAANSLASTCGTVRLRDDKLYYTSGLVTGPNCVGFQGNAKSTIMRQKPRTVINSGTGIVSANAAAFSLLRIGHQGFVKGVNFDGSTSAIVPSAGAVIDFSGSYGVVIEDVLINRSWVGIQSDNGTTVTPQHFRIVNVNVANTLSKGLYLNTAVHGAIDNLTVWNGSTPDNNAFFNHGIGAHLTGGCESLQFNNCLFADMLDGMRADGGAPNYVNNLRINNSIFDAGQNVELVLKDVSFSSITGSWFASTSTYTIYITGGTHGVVISSSLLGGGSASGILFGSSSVYDVIISNNTFNDVGDRGVGSHGVELAANQTKFSIIGNTFQAAAAKMLYSVYVPPGTSDRYIVAHNIGAGTSGFISDNGTGVAKVVSDNVD